MGFLGLKFTIDSVSMLEWMILICLVVLIPESNVHFQKLQKKPKSNAYEPPPPPPKKKKLQLSESNDLLSNISENNPGYFLIISKTVARIFHRQGWGVGGGACPKNQDQIINVGMIGHTSAEDRRLF